jgi:hypothetical protein
LERDVKEVKRILDTEKLEELDSGIRKLIQLRTQGIMFENHRMIGSSSVVTTSGSAGSSGSGSAANKSIGIGHLHYLTRGGVQLFGDYKSEARISSDMNDSTAIQMQPSYKGKILCLLNLCPLLALMAWQY